MGQAVTITRTEWTASDIRTQAAKCEDADQARRLLAIAMILDGATRQDAANTSVVKKLEASISKAGKAIKHPNCFDVIDRC